MTDRQIHGQKQAVRQTESERDRDILTVGQTDRQTDRQRQKDSDREDREISSVFICCHMTRRLEPTSRPIK